MISDPTVSIAGVSHHHFELFDGEEFSIMVFPESIALVDSVTTCINIAASALTVNATGYVTSQRGLNVGIGDDTPISGKISARATLGLSLARYGVPRPGCTETAGKYSFQSTIDASRVSTFYAAPDINDAHIAPEYSMDTCLIELKVATRPGCVISQYGYEINSDAVCISTPLWRGIGNWGIFSGHYSLDLKLDPPPRGGFYFDAHYGNIDVEKMH